MNLDEWLKMNSLKCSNTDNNKVITQLELQDPNNDSLETVISDSSSTIISTKRKKVERSHKFNTNWLECNNFKKWLKRHQESTGGIIEYGFCVLCNTKIYPNKNDILRHWKSDKHTNQQKEINTCQNIETMLNTVKKSHKEKVTYAEIKLVSLLVECDLPFKFMDKLVPILKEVFSCDVVKDIACKRTKASTIVRENLGDIFRKELFSILSQPRTFFSFIMDETTDVSSIKQCAFSVIFYSSLENRIVTKFLDIVETPSGNAENLYGCLKKCLSDKNIPLSNMAGFASDTTNVMVGATNSIFSHLKQDLPEIAFIKCSCHMMHLAASKACLELPRRVEDVLRNIGSHFSRSFSRQEKLKEFQIFFKIDIHKILQPSITRWLSLEACTNRVLEQYNPLKEYFRLAYFEDPSLTTEEILTTLNNEYTRMYLQFMSYILGILNEFNKLFQGSTPLLHKLKPEIIRILKVIYNNYIHAKYFRDKDVLKFDHLNPHQFVDLKHVYFGMAAFESLEKLKTEPNFDEKEMNIFLTSCLKFYVKLSSEIKKRFIFDDTLFDIISILDPLEAQKFEIKTVAHIFSRFPLLKSVVDSQLVENEWREHSLLNYKELGLAVDTSPEEYWHAVFDLKTALGVPLFDNLKIVICFLLVLPFSNASVERIFSSLKIIKTEERNKLGTATVAALLSAKDGIMSQGGCLKFIPSKKMLHRNIWVKHSEQSL